MNDEQLLRYSRQIMLPSIDIDGQQKLLDATVLIVGAGGLGCPAAMYLAAAGVGELIIADDDEVDLSNLQRQIAHGTKDIGTAKTESLKASVALLNTDCQVETVNERLDETTFIQYVQQADVVLDCTDNFDARFAINAACVANKKPLVTGAAIRFEGQVMVYHPGVDGSPCYQCLYPDTGEIEETCSANGVIAPLVGIIGSVQALEAIKCLTGVGESLSNRLLILDGLEMRWREMKTRVDPVCPVCQKSR
jgi:molybdopterin/thiamine biosynthesis adenylyltransferase